VSEQPLLPDWTVRLNLTYCLPDSGIRCLRTDSLWQPGFDSLLIVLELSS
jgi:hypothetical protein